MIKRIDGQWTTIQCKNPRGENEEPCDLCFKVLNDRFALRVTCPYCLQQIDLYDWIKDEEGRKDQPTLEAAAVAGKLERP